MTICLKVPIAKMGRAVSLPQRRKGKSEFVDGGGRVYRVSLTSDDGQGGVCTGFVTVGVPKSMQPGNTPVDDGQLYNSTLP